MGAVDVRRDARRQKRDDENQGESPRGVVSGQKMGPKKWKRMLSGIQREYVLCEYLMSPNSLVLQIRMQLNVREVD